MTKNRTELLKGTLDLMILRTLELQPLHGAAIAERIEQVTGGRSPSKRARCSRPCIVSRSKAGLRASGPNLLTSGA